MLSHMLKLAPRFSQTIIQGSDLAWPTINKAASLICWEGCPWICWFLGKPGHLVTPWVPKLLIKWENQPWNLGDQNVQKHPNCSISWEITKSAIQYFQISGSLRLSAERVFQRPRPSLQSLRSGEVHPKTSANFRWRPGLCNKVGNVSSSSHLACIMATLIGDELHQLEDSCRKWRMRLSKCVCFLALRSHFSANMMYKSTQWGQWGRPPIFIAQSTGWALIQPRDFPMNPKLYVACMSQKCQHAPKFFPISVNN